jgi:hypothetical protein
MQTKISTSADTIEETTGANFIGSSGVYPIHINFANLTPSNTNGSKAEQVNFNIDYNGNSQVLYGPYVQKKDGNVNEIGYGLLVKLGVIAGMVDGDDFQFSEETHPVGKDNKQTDFTVIDQLSDFSVYVHVQEEYSRYEGKIRQNLVIKAFFDENGASAEELVNDAEIGARFALVEEKYANNITYKDDLTEDDIKKWIAGGRGKNSATDTATATATAKKPARASFKRNTN